MKTIIELVGLPATGKTTFIKKVIEETRGISNVEVIRDASEANPLQNKKNQIDFNLWNISKIINELKNIENRKHDLVVIEKGIFDITAWLNWHRDYNSQYHEN